MTGEQSQQGASHAHDESSNRGADRAWFHFMFNSYGTWIRGDKRGFRDHDHRVHSSGDYERPPPNEEHAGLRRWTLAHMRKDPVRLSHVLRKRVGEKLVGQLIASDVELVAVAVMGDHVHGLGKFYIETKEKLVGDAKRVSSHSVRADIPGNVWAKKCLFKRIRDEKHQQGTFEYICNHVKEGAWLWTFRDMRRD